MKIKYLKVTCVEFSLVATPNAYAVGAEDSNTCRSTTGDFCERSGSCSIQCSDCYQYVTTDKSDILDAQGWPGLCDMLHVSLVQGNCWPPASRVDVTAYLSDTTYASIPSITGVLACNAPIVNDGDLAPWDAADGKINKPDVLIAAQLVLGLRTACSLQVAHGDMNLDGVIDLADLLLIQQAVFQ